MSTLDPSAIDSAPRARGTASSALLSILRGTNTRGDSLAALAESIRVVLDQTPDLLSDEDLQLTLYLLYTLHYGPTRFIGQEWEWHPELIRARQIIEAEFESALRTAVPMPTASLPVTGSEVSELLFSMTAEANHPRLAKWLARHASVEQLREFLIHRSIYTLREADPHSWAIPRLRGRAKAALVEIQSDEYGGGRPERVHAEIFARTMRNFGLDATPDNYLDAVPAITLTSFNMMSLFGLHRRLRGAIVGHLAAFEMTSSIPNRHYSHAFSRLGYGKEVTWYFDEHVEADAVHEQIAGRDLAGSLADDEPELIPDIVFGAAACLFIDDLAGRHLLDSWSAERSSLRTW